MNISRPSDGKLNSLGCPWRYLPKDFPPYTLVNYYYNKWTHSGLLEQINAALRARALIIVSPKTETEGQLKQY
jgi:transposase